MSKARPIIPSRDPGTAGDRNPSKGNPRPAERDAVYEKIGHLIIKAWRATGGTRPLDRETLEQEIEQFLNLSGDPKGKVEVGVIVDPPPQQGRKFVWIVVPYPEAPDNVSFNDWLDEYEQSVELSSLLGESTLFGCGR